jgi:hypothetical protein
MLSSERGELEYQYQQVSVWLISTHHIKSLLSLEGTGVFQCNNQVAMNLVWERYPWLLQEDDANAEADRQRRWELHAAATQACAAVWLSGLRRLAEGQSKVSCP